MSAPAIQPWYGLFSRGARDWLRRLGAGAVLLRPDRYVAGLAAAPQDVKRLLQFAAVLCEQLAPA